jgi:hypothetical protein
MPRKQQTLRKTMVIVCEDSVLTPKYLNEIIKDAIVKNEWSNVDIFPIPPPEKTTVKNNIPDKSKRKTRSFHVEIINVPFEIEDQFKAVPVRYVREAQLRILESGYDEGWAVYDLDGHSKHAEAYALSLTNPVVKLAFSSVAIEHWFLLHFVRDATTYGKSEHVPILTYIPNYTKTGKGGIDLFNSTYIFLDIALENSAWLRTINTQYNKLCYEINPYIDMDILIKSLFGITETLSWGFLDIIFFIKKIEFFVTKNEDYLEITITNRSATSILSSQISFYFLDSKRTKLPLTVTFPLLKPGNSNSISLSLPLPGLLNISFENHRVIIEI